MHQVLKEAVQVFKHTLAGMQTILRYKTAFSNLNLKSHACCQMSGSLQICLYFWHPNLIHTHTHTPMQPKQSNVHHILWMGGSSRDFVPFLYSRLGQGLLSLQICTSHLDSCEASLLSPYFTYSYVYLFYLFICIAHLSRIFKAANNKNNISIFHRLYMFSWGPLYNITSEYSLFSHMVEC